MPGSYDGRKEKGKRERWVFWKKNINFFQLSFSFESRVVDVSAG